MFHLGHWWFCLLVTCCIPIAWWSYRSFQLHPSTHVQWWPPPWRVNYVYFSSSKSLLAPDFPLQEEEVTLHVMQMPVQKTSLSSKNILSSALSSNLHMKPQKNLCVLQGHQKQCGKKRHSLPRHLALKLFLRPANTPASLIFRRKVCALKDTHQVLERCPLPSSHSNKKGGPKSLAVQYVSSRRECHFLFFIV